MARAIRGPWLQCSAEASPGQQCLILLIFLGPVSRIYASAECSDTWSIHREAPAFTEQSTEQEILATGIKVGNKFCKQQRGFWRQRAAEKSLRIAAV